MQQWHQLGRHPLPSTERLAAGEQVTQDQGLAEVHLPSDVSDKKRGMTEHDSSPGVK